jgi:hypothetical protein
LKIGDIQKLSDDDKFKVDFQDPKNWVRNAKQAIRLMCFYCLGFDSGYHSAVDGCTAHLCPIWPFRSGKNPSELKKRPRVGKAEEVAPENHSEAL